MQTTEKIEEKNTDIENSITNGDSMIKQDIAEINLGNKLKENPNDLMVMVEVKEKLSRILEDMEV